MNQFFLPDPPFCPGDGKSARRNHRRCPGGCLDVLSAQATVFFALEKSTAQPDRLAGREIDRLRDHWRPAHLEAPARQSDACWLAAIAALATTACPGRSAPKSGLLRPGALALELVRQSAAGERSSRLWNRIAPKVIEGLDLLGGGVKLTGGIYFGNTQGPNRGRWPGWRAFKHDGLQRFRNRPDRQGWVSSWRAKAPAALQC